MPNISKHKVGITEFDSGTDACAAFLYLYFITQRSPAISQVRCGADEAIDVALRHRSMLEHQSGKRLTIIGGHTNDRWAVQTVERAGKNLLCDTAVYTHGDLERGVPHENVVNKMATLLLDLLYDAEIHGRSLSSITNVELSPVELITIMDFVAVKAERKLVQTGIRGLLDDFNKFFDGLAEVKMTTASGPNCCDFSVEMTWTAPANVDCPEEDRTWYMSVGDFIQRSTSILSASVKEVGFMKGCMEDEDFRQRHLYRIEKNIERMYDPDEILPNMGSIEDDLDELCQLIPICAEMDPIEDNVWFILHAVTGRFGLAYMHDTTWEARWYVDGLESPSTKKCSTFKEACEVIYRASESQLGIKKP